MKMFSYEVYKNFKNTYFEVRLQITASGQTQSKLEDENKMKNKK